MKKALRDFKKDINFLNYDFENQTLDSIIAEWWFSYFGVSNVEKQKRLKELYLNQ